VSNSCPHDLKVTEEEIAGIEWLRKTFEKILRNPDHVNYQNAQNASNAIGKLFDKVADLHDRVHELESANGADLDIAYAAARLSVQEVGEA
jgi:hypothetical protein